MFKCLHIVLCLCAVFCADLDQYEEEFDLNPFYNDLEEQDHAVVKESDDPYYTDDMWQCGDCDDENLTELYTEDSAIVFDGMEVQMSLTVPDMTCVKMSGAAMEAVALQRSGGACSGGGSVSLIIRRGNVDRANVTLTVYGRRTM